MKTLQELINENKVKEYNRSGVFVSENIDILDEIDIKNLAGIKILSSDKYIIMLKENVIDKTSFKLSSNYDLSKDETLNNSIKELLIKYDIYNKYSMYHIKDEKILSITKKYNIDNIIDNIKYFINNIKYDINMYIYRNGYITINIEYNDDISSLDEIISKIVTL